MSETMQDDVDERRESTTPRSEYIREAILVRFALEDAGSWDDELGRARERFPTLAGGGNENESTTEN